MGLFRSKASDRPPTHPAIVAANRRAWIRVGVLTAVVVLPVAGWVAITVLTRGPIPAARPLDGVAAGGSGELTLRWTAEPCERVAADRTEVVELPSEVLVVLRVVRSEDATTCDRPGERTHSVTLEEPLGDRELFDGACVAPENLGHDPRCPRAEREIEVRLPAERRGTKASSDSHNPHGMPRSQSNVGGRSSNSS